MKDRFSQIKGVGNVNIVGGQQREIRVELDNRVVYQNVISLPQLNQMLTAENIDIPGGQIQKESQEYSSRVKGKFNSIDEMKKLQIQTLFGPKELGKIANVKDDGKEVRIRSTYINNITKQKTKT